MENAKFQCVFDPAHLSFFIFRMNVYVVLTLVVLKTRISEDLKICLLSEKYVRCTRKKGRKCNFEQISQVKMSSCRLSNLHKK